MTRSSGTILARAGRRFLALSLLPAALSLSGCVAGGYEEGSAYYDGGADVGYGVDFYEPYGYAYGGWGRGYRVGPPPRRDDHRPDHPPGIRPEPHPGRPPVYHPAPASRPTPSIPTGSRGGRAPHAR